VALAAIRDGAAAGGEVTLQTALSEFNLDPEQDLVNVEDLEDLEAGT
jgi:hypothetical protein